MKNYLIKNILANALILLSLFFLAFKIWLSRYFGEVDLDLLLININFGFNGLLDTDEYLIQRFFQIVILLPIIITIIIYFLFIRGKNSKNKIIIFASLFSLSFLYFISGINLFKSSFITDHSLFIEKNYIQPKISNSDFKNKKNLILVYLESFEKDYLTNKNLALYQAPQGKPHYKLAGGQMNFIDTVSIVEGGGKAGVAYVHGERQIDATDWFFRYHFHQDPVMPGSLGVEAIIELMQTYALKKDLGKDFANPRFIAPMTLVKWKYRGQITPINKQMSLDVHITDIIKTDGEIRLVGDANLSKDGLRIYEVKDIVLSIIEA